MNNPFLALVGINLNKLIDGKTLSDHWQYYTINVKKLETMTHAEFCQEFPNAAQEIQAVSELLDRLETSVKEG